MPHMHVFYFQIQMYKDCAEFLVLLAKRFGMLKKGGLPDTVKAARLVLQDWNWLVMGVYFLQKKRLVIELSQALQS